jgi:hypothetical protein
MGSIRMTSSESFESVVDEEYARVLALPISGLPQSTNGYDLLALLRIF